MNTQKNHHHTKSTNFSGLCTSRFGRPNVGGPSERGLVSSSGDFFTFLPEADWLRVGGFDGLGDFPLPFGDMDADSLG